MKEGPVEMTNVPTAPIDAPSPAAMVLAGAAGQPSQTRIARTGMLREITRLCYAVDQPALPAPQAVRFDADPAANALQLVFDSADEVKAWQDRLGGLRLARHWSVVGGTGYHAIVDWRGVRVDLVSVTPVIDESAAVSA
jgi:hypothetical protein